MLVLNSGVTIAGSVCDEYVWNDSTGQPRSVALVRTDVKGGHAKQFTYQLTDGTVRVINESPAAGGFGYVVSHLRDASVATRHGEDDSPLGSNLDADATALFIGDNHAVHEFTLNYPRWGIDPATGADAKYNVPVRIQWLMAAGRDHPLWTVTFDVSNAPANAIEADARAPYGDMLFDGATAETGDQIGGVAWGESYRFVSTGSPLTLSSGWDWSQPNLWAPYNLLWTHNVDAEMGIVGTSTNWRQPAGGYEGLNGRGFNSASASLRCAAEGYVMPCTWGWPFQSVNFAFADATTPTSDKRLAWGVDWGCLGRETVQTSNGVIVRGWPTVSYSTYIVLGEHSRNPTVAMAQQALAAATTSLTTSIGSVVAHGPPGIGRLEQLAYMPVGYNAVYGTWDVTAANGNVSLQLAVGGDIPLYAPVFVVHQYTGNPVSTSVSLDGTRLQNEVEFLVSSRPDTQDLWVTINKSLAGIHTLDISG